MLNLFLIFKTMYILILCLASFAFGYFIRKLSERKVIPVEKDDRVHIIKPNLCNTSTSTSTTTLSIYTFSQFWEEFHRVNNIRKVDKVMCFKIWHDSNFYDRKKKAITEITKTDLSAFKYLKSKL